MKSIYTYYKQRLIEITGKNRSLYAKGINKKYTYDLGKLIGEDEKQKQNLLDFLWKGKKRDFCIIGKETKHLLADNLGAEERVIKRLKPIDQNLSEEQLKQEHSRRDKLVKQEIKKLIENECTGLKNLKRNIEEVEKETGRYELFVGYPFVEGEISKDVIVRAPLLLFPVAICDDENNEITIEFKKNELIKLNKVFILAYAQAKKLDVSEMEMDFESLQSSKMQTVEDVLKYLGQYNIKVNPCENKNISCFTNDISKHTNQDLEVKNYCVLGRYPLANSIYNDYELLEKKKLTNKALDELLSGKNHTNKNKQPKTQENIFTVNKLDYAQESAIRALDKNGNLVVYGPPGTGKSQTIVNIIADSLCKNKRVLVVSQKKAALEVVFNRLGDLNDKAMFLIDDQKDKNTFYERVKTKHYAIARTNYDFATEKYNSIAKEVEDEVNGLKTISDILFSPTPFGLTLQQMYANSYIIGKNTSDYNIYQKLINTPDLMKLTHQELYDACRLIDEKQLGKIYYDYIESKTNNPLIDYVKPNIESHVLNETKILLNKLLNQRTAPFDMAKYEYSREVIAYYYDAENKNNTNLKPLIKFIASTKNDKKLKKSNAQIQLEFNKTLSAIEEYTKNYSFLQNVLTSKGYTMALDYVLNGNTQFTKLLQSTLDDYAEIRDMKVVLSEVTDIQTDILKFAYNNSKTFKEFKYILDKLLVIRIYHEIVKLEDIHKHNLAKIMNYENTKNRIMSLISEQKTLAKQICSAKFCNEYIEYYQKQKDNQNFLYQITKQKDVWPIRKLMEKYDEYLFNLFPCWLLSPESVSTILPLKKNMFDIVLFDEASQVFIENTIPAIYRGQNIVVAGDNKQLKPTSLFIKRYMGNDDEDLDQSTLDALEVDSLLDLATVRYTSAYLTYHYRSKSEELINFSNRVFYDGKLEIAPNVNKKAGKQSIERILVDGKWIDRKNVVEAKEVVNVIKKIFKTRKENQSIGVITFNIEQESAIEDAIDQEIKKDEWFRKEMLKERNRKDNGEDTSIFIKNLENVQGDERDIIIFSIGYAKNEYGKVVSYFGQLSVDGGENRLNVAITRSKQKIYVVTSIEPEELSVEATKNNGPKIFKNYLKYVRAVSLNRQDEANAILDKYCTFVSKKTKLSNISMQIKQELEKNGYCVDLGVGNSDYKISLGVYSKKHNTYVLGIECDNDTYYSSDSVMERDIFRPVFLNSRHWNLTRVWSRDWWTNKTKVLNKLTKLIDTNLAKLEQAKLKPNK